MRQIIVGLIVIMLASCNGSKKSEPLFQPHNLEAQRFVIRTDQDTTLKSKGGMLIQLKAGDISSATSDSVRLVIIEALSIRDMILGGLNSQSNKLALSSGGMFSINVADGQDAKIKNSFKVFVPTDYYNSDMNVYKGEEKSSRINWINPEKLPEDDIVLSKIKVGESLYQANCSSCHKMDADYTAPPLFGVTDRLPKEWLFDFTKWPEKMNTAAANKANKSSLDLYTICLFDTWKPTVMSNFNHLSDTDLENIYMYIKSESDKISPDLNSFLTSCNDFIANKPLVYDKLDTSISFLNLYRVDYVESDPTEEEELLFEEEVYYYQVIISDFGWTNIDMLLEKIKNCLESKLVVDIKSAKENEFYYVSLVIPSVRSNISLDFDSKKNLYGVFNDSIPLPRKEKCYIICYNDFSSEEFKFSIHEFIPKDENIIIPELRTGTQQEFQKLINTLFP